MHTINRVKTREVPQPRVEPPQAATAVTLHCPSFSLPVLNHLFAKLESDTSADRLIVEGRIKGDGGMPAFVKMLRMNAHLRDLTLKQAMPGGLATHELVKALAHHTSIECITINAIRPGNVRRVAGILAREGTKSLSSLSLEGGALSPRAVDALVLLIEAGHLDTLTLAFDLTDGDVLWLLSKARPTGGTKVIFHPPVTWSADRQRQVAESLAIERTNRRDALHRVHGLPSLVAPPDECFQLLKDAHALCEAWDRFIDPSAQVDAWPALPHEQSRRAGGFVADARTFLRQLHALPTVAPALAHLAPHLVNRCEAVLAHAELICTQGPAFKLAGSNVQKPS